MLAAALQGAREALGQGEVPPAAWAHLQVSLDQAAALLVSAWERSNTAQPGAMR